MNSRKNTLVRSISFNKSWNWKSHAIVINFLVFIGFIIFALIANWSIVLGENLMKWDIWEADYPMQVLVSDAFNNGDIILWNPLFRYGTPHYASVGTPVWYPVNLLLAFIGYTPAVLGFSYAIHVAIGGFGMYLLGKQELFQKDTSMSVDKVISSVIVGLIYCTSGVFLSNAQHIMIIISAAWIPYVFYFMRSYLEKKLIVYAMLSALAAAMLLLGGYPEMFYDTFLFLLIYSLFFANYKKGNYLINILQGLKAFVLVGIFTVLCAAITIIPFLNIMNLLTRTSGYAPIPMDIELNALLSVVLPNVSTFVPLKEFNMGNYYVGLLTIILIPIIIKYQNRNHYFYCGMAVLSILLCLGSNSFLYGILYRFFPMYSSFRFPTTNRCTMAMFLMLCIINIIYDILNQKFITRISHSAKILFGLVIGSAVIVELFSNLQTVDDTSLYTVYTNCAYISAILLGIYILALHVLKTDSWMPKSKKILFGMAVLIELLTFHHLATPVTIAAYSPTAFEYNRGVREDIEAQYTKLTNHITSTNFADCPRATNGLDSQNIVFNRMLDEEGYTCILLQSTKDYMNTYLRSIMEQNPEVYFTNDIVDSGDVNYEEWVNSGSTAPEQIYVEEKQQNYMEDKVRFSTDIITEEALMWQIEDDVIHIQGTDLNSGSNQTGRIRLFLKSKTDNTMELWVTYLDTEGNSAAYHDFYYVHNEDMQPYIDIYMPSIAKTYSDIYINLSDTVPDDIALVNVDRMRQDEFVDVNYFGFNDIEMNVMAPTDGFVTILQANYNGWKAYVDGVETDITEIDRCFMGVKVSEGNHNIVLKFRPFDFYVGLIMTMGYVILLLVMVAITIRRHYKMKKVNLNE